MRQRANQATRTTIVRGTWRRFFGHHHGECIGSGLGFWRAIHGWDREGDGALATCAAAATEQPGFGLPATGLDSAAPTVATASLTTATSAAREARVRRLSEVVGTGRGDKIARSLSGVSAGSSCFALREKNAFERVNQPQGVAPQD